MFFKLFRKFRTSSSSSNAAAHNLPLDYSAYDYDAEPLHDDASYATSISDTKPPTLVETPHKPLKADMLEEDNMAWGHTHTHKAQPTPPYVQPASHYLLQESELDHHGDRAEMLEEDNMAWVSTTKIRKSKPAYHYMKRAETLTEDNRAWGLPLGRKLKPASHYVERAEMLEEDNRAW